MEWDNIGRMILIGTLVVSAIFLAYCFWSIHCIRKVGEQKKLLIDIAARESSRAIAIGDVADEQWMQWFDMVKHVSFDRHLWYVETFRDPFQLYDPRLRAKLYPGSVQNDSDMMS